MADQHEASAFQITMISLLTGLINELSISIQFENSYLTAILPDLKDAKNPTNEISAHAKRNPFSSDIQITDVASILINKSPLKFIEDLAILGFNEQQLNLLKENLSATIYLENIYEQSKTQRPKMLNIFEEILHTKIEFSDPHQPGILAHLFSVLPQREAFILSDTCGNIDGSTGNPLKNVMFGEIDDAIKHHPISIAFEHGCSKLYLIEVDPSEIRSMGIFPPRLSILKPELMPVCEYAFDVSARTSSPFTSSKSLNTFTLSSKRAFIPVTDDYQIKTGFPGQITSEPRTIDWTNARDVTQSSHILQQLAVKSLLPDNYSVLLTPYVAQKTDDERTTYYLRDGLGDAISNTNEKGIPKQFTPITAFALTSRNILTHDKTLFESMIEYGFDGLELFKSISKSMIYTQLNMFKLGFIPDSHTQNVVYLFDFQKKTFAGVLNRDVECEKLLLRNLAKYHLILPSESDISTKLLRNLSHDDRKLFTLYFHHTIYTKHIIPIATCLHEKYHIDSKVLCDCVKSYVIEWKKENPNVDIEQDLDLSGRFYERNLACKTLHLGEPPHYRLIDNHPLLAQNRNAV